MDAGLTARYGSAEGAARYRRKYERSLARRLSNRRELAVVRRALERAGASGRLLDCPCGAGRLTPTLLGVAEHVTAADVSAAMVAEAKDALAPVAAQGRVDFVVAPAQSLPFPDGAFDTAVCHRLIHHMPDAAERAGVFRELARVARRRVVLSFSDASTTKARLRAWRGITGRGRTMMRPEELAAEAATHGLALDGRVTRLNGLFSLLSVAVFRVRDAR
jgi:ubiquinone/menaquinone biosynthesis C-methylase UbiE